MTTPAIGAPIVQTTGGTLSGSTIEGIHAFKGIPYAAPATGTNRFMPPAPPEPWEGVREALAFGDMAPQSLPGAARSVTQQLDAATGDESENCLVLNVYTPALDGARPVMVWLHGGGFVSGSGGPAYDGSNLARRGDVVVVTLNHRLGALGYLHLGDIDPRFARSGNVGMLDIVAALEWVRDNAAAFGGDAGNVTIFGESGGGRKVASLMAMPPARGLFHKAIIESGPGMRVNEREYGTEFATAFLAELGVVPGALSALQEMPLERILAAQFAVQRASPSALPGIRGGFRPVIDPEVLPAHPFLHGAPAQSAGIPLLIGFNRTEATLFLANDKEVYELDDDGLQRRTTKLFGERAAGILADMRAAYPDASPSDLYILIHTGSLRYPIDSIKLAETKAAGGGAPVFLYRFDWESTARYGRLRTPHALEIPFVFDQTEHPSWRGLTRATPEAAALAARVSATWAAFARTGEPNGGGLPHWDAFEPGGRRTMVIDNESHCESDPDGAERLVWERTYWG